MIKFSQDQNVKLNNFCLYLMVITTMIGPMIYIGFASLYHFVVFAMLIVVLYKGINTGNFRTGIITFLFLWFVEAAVSVIWAPDKMIALQYVYYIFLILGICVLFHCFLSKENLMRFSHFMVFVLFACNLVAFWEINTGNHLVADYLSTPLRLRLLKYVPSGFYRNPNDFATFIIQSVPFSFMCLSSSKRIIRMMSMFNVLGSFITVCATQSRTQIILMLAMYIFVALVFKKRTVIKYSLVACLVAMVLYFIYPQFRGLIDEAMESVSSRSLASNMDAEGGSVNTRINLLKNAGYILLDTFGFGIGAGCHRAVMAEYSSTYFDSHGVLIMHNLLGEIFVDYGVVMGIAFIIAIVISCYRLVYIYRTVDDYNIRTLSIMLAFSLGVMILCGMSSSSILQLTSVWLTFCFTSAFIKLY